MGGLELIKRVRKESGIPIIAVTAFSDIYNHDAVLQAGANVYRSKPLRIDRLLRDIDELLNSEEE